MKVTTVKLSDEVCKGITGIIVKKNLNLKQQGEVINFLLKRAIDSINKEGSI